MADTERSARPLIYCHGMPGGPGEVALAGVPLRIAMALDRNAFGRNRSNEEAVKAMAAAITRIHPAGSMGLIGFSLGAKTALDLAAILGSRVAEIHLISSAGPVLSPAMLNAMAGGAIFKLAKTRAWILPAVAKLQSLLARQAPGLLFDMLFARAQGGDAALAQDADFKMNVSNILRTGLGQSTAAWVREVAAYVEPWGDHLWPGTAPVTLWHGEADTWSPPAMAADLADRLGARADVRLLPGLSHYSTLIHVLPMIAAD